MVGREQSAIEKLFSLLNFVLFKKKLLEEQEEYSKRLRTELEVTYKSQWQKEKEADIKQSLENEVATLKAQWEREQKEVCAGGGKGGGGSHTS